MIPLRFRTWARSGNLPADRRRAATWSIVDWDTHRWFTVECPAEVFADEDGEKACEAIIPYLDDLDPDVKSLVISTDGKLLSTSTDPQFDCTLYVQYPPFTEDYMNAEDASECLKRSDLQEVDRLFVNVDLVALRSQSDVTASSPNHPELLVFKYATMIQPLRDVWHEAFLLKRLKACPHVVPFHKFVIDEVEPVFLGYTMAYVHGISILDVKIPFRRRWLSQLLEVVDNLNLNYGIIHQDIAPRNLILDSETDELTLIDFGMADLIGSERIYQPRNDIDGVIYTVYEILTGDEHFRWGVHPDDYNIEDVTSLPEWPLKIDLEPDLEIKSLRSMVMDWADSRKKQQPQPQPAPESQQPRSPRPVQVPPFPPPEPQELGPLNIPPFPFPGYFADVLAKFVPAGTRVVRWERPPQSKTTGHQQGKINEEWVFRWTKSSGLELNNLVQISWMGSWD